VFAELALKALLEYLSFLTKWFQADCAIDPFFVALLVNVAKATDAAARCQQRVLREVGLL